MFFFGLTNGFVEKKMEQQQSFVPVQIQWKNINYTVVKQDTSGFRALCRTCRKKFTTINVLQDISGVVEPGNTLAIVGPSGNLSH
jgi:ABC-type multidrug transport system fused ATPase/permease subunit